VIHRRFISQYRAIYRPIFQILAVFCCKRFGKRFPHIVSAASKKRRIGRYLGRIGRFLKQGLSYNGVLLRCLSNSEAQKVIKKVHDGICGAHQSGVKLKDRLHRLGYYWPTMIADVVQYAKWCRACQIHADFIHQPLELFYCTVTSGPFEAWGIDV